MDKFGIYKTNINPLSGINEMVRKQEKERKEMLEAVNKTSSERIEREKKGIELQETIAEQNSKLLKLQETEIDFLKSMSEDASKIVALIKNLETINARNGNIAEVNMLEIEEILKNLEENTSPDKLYESFINEAKNQIVSIGVASGLQFLLLGLKKLITK